MRKMIKNITLYRPDYECLKDLKIVPSESFNDTLNRLLDMIEKGEPIQGQKDYELDKTDTRSIKVSVETYRRLRLWKKPSDSFPLSIHNLLTNNYEATDVPNVKYEIHHEDYVFLFKLVGGEVYYWNSVDEKWENDVLAWLTTDNAGVIRDVISFFDNFLLKPSARTLLEGMGDELVYGDYSIVKLE